MHVNHLASANKVLQTINSQAQAGNVSSRVQQDQVSQALNLTQSETQNSKSLNNKQQADAVVRFDVDESAIALIEQELNERANLSINSSAENTSATSGTALKVDSVHGQSYKADYDQPSQYNQSAVAIYQSVGNLAQRDSIQQIFGVDLFV